MCTSEWPGSTQAHTETASEVCKFDLHAIHVHNASGHFLNCVHVSCVSCLPCSAYPGQLKYDGGGGGEAKDARGGAHLDGGYAGADDDKQRGEKHRR